MPTLTEEKIIHKSVMLDQVVDLMDLSPGLVVVDCTLGAGGHSKVISEQIGAGGVILGIDADADSIEMARKRIEGTPAKKILVKNNFRNLKSILSDVGLERVDRVLFDFGMSSMNIELSGRGFSFNKEEPLLMTYDNETKDAITAIDVVNNWQEENLADIIYGFGGERFARRIARAIVEYRKVGPISNSKILAEIVSNAVPIWYRMSRIHPATKTFQAIRMAVNDEVGAIRDGLQAGWDALSSGGRMVAISFHEIEDRMVKRFMRSKVDLGEAELLTKKPICPDRDEIMENPRSRSAKLRGVIKL